MNNPQCHNSTGEQDALAWQEIRRRWLDILDNLSLPVRNAVSLQRRASASEQHATERHRILPRSSESNDAVATDVSIHSTVAEELSVPPSDQSAPCPLCRISDRRSDQSDFRSGDWLNIDVWVDSASRGCNYCRIIASGAVRNFRPYRGAPNNIKLRVRALAGPFRNMVIDMRSRNDDLQSWEFHVSKGDFHCYSVFGPYTRVWSKPSKESQIHRAACEIRDCVENHKACHQNPSKPPSRLIEISLVNGENMLRLVDTQTLDKGSKQRYIALSYCWGSGPPLRLLKSNLASMKARIPWEAFPRLFRNAIELTWSLDVRYLWIDAFCIIQDDDLDWQTESARMGDIYRSSFVTVSASTASDTGGTIFAENGESLRADGSPHHQGGLSSQVSDTKIHTRAWTFQEFILPRRVLEFNHSGQKFHCCTPKREGGPYLRRPVPGCFEVSHLYRARLDFNMVLKSYNANDQVWCRIIEGYALRDLTRLSDRLPALSGLASLYMKQTALKGRYLAGLWQRSFLHGLHWVSSRDIAQTISKYHAPSWSWSSLTRPVTYCATLLLPSPQEDLSDSRCVLRGPWGPDLVSIRGTPSFAQVIHVQCEIRGSNPFGEVTSGTAVLRGLLLDARMSFQPDVNGSASPQLELMNSTRHMKCSGHGVPGNPQPMPSWVKWTGLPYLADNQEVYLDSEVEMVSASRSLPRTCAYLRRRQLARQVDGLSEAWTPEETNSACLHVSVLILASCGEVLVDRANQYYVSGLVLGRPDPDKEVYERLGIFWLRSSISRPKNERKHFIGAVKDVTII